MTVSILVMLEVKWKVKIMRLLLAIEFRFNPCYVGSKMERKNPIAHICTIGCFNPCYVGSKMESIM